MSDVDEKRRAGQPSAAIPAAIAPQTLAHIRMAGPRLPRLPGTDGKWVPRTRAEQDLLSECRRLDELRQLLLDEIDRLRQVYAGRAVQPPRTGNAGDSPLTPAELRVLVAAAAGEEPQETARRLCLGYETIKGQRVLARKRLAARSIPHAVAMAVAAGWIPGEAITEGLAP